jgi:hypothetical protein
MSPCSAYSVHKYFVFSLWSCITYRMMRRIKNASNKMNEEVWAPFTSHLHTKSFILLT